MEIIIRNSYYTKNSNLIILLQHSKDTLQIRFYLLALLSGLILIVALPFGIAFFIFVALYYLACNKEENKVVAFDVDTSDPNSDVETPDPNPDFNKLFNGKDFVQEQEKLR